MSLRIDRLFPQHFTEYTVRATNTQGVAVLRLKLARGRSVGRSVCCYTGL